jgi:hypothetical protein
VESSAGMPTGAKSSAAQEKIHVMTVTAPRRWIVARDRTMYAE